jgi:hypothetical protein
MRPGMYIGKLGDGNDDGIYILVKRFSITVSMNLQWVLENY